MRQPGLLRSKPSISPGALIDYGASSVLSVGGAAGIPSLHLTSIKLTVRYTQYKAQHTLRDRKRSLQTRCCMANERGQGAARPEYGEMGLRKGTPKMSLTKSAFRDSKAKIRNLIPKSHRGPAGGGGMARPDVHRWNPPILVDGSN
jgi:hypothetical protein